MRWQPLLNSEVHKSDSNRPPYLDIRFELALRPAPLSLVCHCGGSSIRLDMFRRRLLALTSETLRRCGTLQLNGTKSFRLPARFGGGALCTMLCRMGIARKDPICRSLHCRGRTGHARFDRFRAVYPQNFKVDESNIHYHRTDFVLN